MKLIINNKSNKVVYAEADKDCLDYLLNVFAMPLGSAMNQVFKDAIVGGIGNLLKSVGNDLSLDFPQVKFQTQSALMLPNSIKTIYACPLHKDYVQDVNSARCPYCSSLLNYKLPYFAKIRQANGRQATYMITDDLVIKPLSTVSTIALLNQLNLKDLGCIEEYVVTLDAKQVQELLKSSLMSTTVLTDTFLVKKQI